MAQPLHVPPKPSESAKLRTRLYELSMSRPFAQVNAFIFHLIFVCLPSEHRADTSTNRKLNICRRRFQSFHSIVWTAKITVELFVAESSHGMSQIIFCFLWINAANLVCSAASLALVIMKRFQLVMVCISDPFISYTTNTNPSEYSSKRIRLQIFGALVVINSATLCIPWNVEEEAERRDNDEEYKLFFATALSAIINILFAVEVETNDCYSLKSTCKNWRLPARNFSLFQRVSIYCPLKEILHHNELSIGCILHILSSEIMFYSNIVNVRFLV